MHSSKIHFDPPTLSPAIHDLLIPVLSTDTLDFPHLATTATTCHDRSTAGLRTLGTLLRLVDRDDVEIKPFLLSEVGALVSHLADYIDAMATLESQATYQQNRLRS